MEHEGVFTMEEESPVNLLTLDIAEGSIGAEHTDEVIDTAESIVNGDYHRTISGEVICKCIDGRNTKFGIEGPNSAGGTLSLLVADDLTSQRFIASDEPTELGMGRLVSELGEQGQAVGIHSDTHASGENCGCGANDKLPQIYAMMVKKADDIHELAGMILGEAVSEDVHSLIVSRASERTIFSTGAEVKAAAIDAATDEVNEVLEGDHKEVVAVINKVPNTSLDRDSLEDSTSGEYQAFNVDAWSFEASARVISENDDDMIKAKVVALTYYNLATALVLCGPNMLVGIRD